MSPADARLDAILRPRSIAVVGASRKPHSIGREILHNLIRFGFNGPVYPVNPALGAVHSIRAYPSLRDIPDPVDLAIIVVPRAAVPAVLDDAVARGVRGLVVITAGYRETGAEGARAEEELKAKVRGAGIRMVGPNCMGVINTDPEVRMNATFAATTPIPGTAGFMSQSGALGEMILERAEQIGLGIACFVSMGNKTDVSGNDLLEAWEADPRINVILMYLESFGNPDRFAAITRRVTRRKPILAVKSGRSAAGAKAAFSHTGSLAGSEVAVDSLLEQCGVLRMGTLSELFNLATALAHQPLPAGNRIAILTNAGGPAIMATDALAMRGLDVVELPPATQAALRAVLAPEASVRNPVDMIASADGPRYDAALKILTRDQAIDGLLVLFVSPITINALDVARAIVANGRGARLPILTCFMGKEQGRQGVEELRRAGLPVYLFPEEAARAMAGLLRYRRLRDRPEGTTPVFEVDRPRARAALARAAAEKRQVLSLVETSELLAAYGLPVVPTRVVRSGAEAIEAASELGYPVVVKGQAEGLVHKTDVGAVKVDLRNGDDVAEACRAIARSVAAAGTGTAAVAQAPGAGSAGAIQFVVQTMVRGGHETILGLSHDPQFGPLLMFGLGGIFVEVMKDVVFRVLPLTDVEARDMVRSIRGYPIRAGTRGGPRADENFLVEAVLRLGQLAAECPEIDQVDMNPLIIGTAREQSFVVDARIRLKSPADGAVVSRPRGAARARSPV
jgi:acetyl coenzyme A synthetase (ADP forming)-like protein